MSFSRITAADREGMLAALGARSLEDLLRGIPSELRLDGLLALDAGLPPSELLAQLEELASWNSTLEQGAFLGAGLYRHYVPTAVDLLLSRPELVAALTRHEAGAGARAARVELQAMLAELLGLRFAFAHDGANVAAEAVLSASAKLRERKRVVLSRGVHPHTRRCIETHLRATNLTVVEAPLASDGRTVFSSLVNDETCAVLVQSLNALGVLECIDEVAALAKARGAISICSAYPISLGVLKSPGEAGFDIAIGDGQCLGNAVALGGSSVGFIACTQEIADEWRERSAKEATSLSSSALRAALYLAAAGPIGLAEVAHHCIAKAQYAANAVSTLAGFELPFAQGGFFNEFVLRCPVSAASVNRAIDRTGMIGGLNLARWYPELGDNDLLLSFTELTTRAQIDALVATLAKISHALPVV